MNKKQKMIANIVVFIIGLLIAFSICYSAEIFLQPQSEMMKIISNAFLLPGVIFTGLGALIFVSNEGYFNIFDFSFKQLFSSFGKKEKRKAFRDKYPDFYTYNKEKRKEQAQFTFILFPGILFMLLSALFTVLFYYI